MSLKSKNQSLELLDIIKTKVVKVVEILHKFVFGKRFIHQVENDFNWNCQKKFLIKLLKITK